MAGDRSPDLDRVWSTRDFAAALAALVRPRKTREVEERTTKLEADARAARPVGELGVVRVTRQAVSEYQRGVKVPDERALGSLLTIAGVRSEAERAQWFTARQRVVTPRRPAGAVLVADADPRLLGVHKASAADPASQSGGAADAYLPAYVERDHDTAPDGLPRGRRPLLLVNPTLEVVYLERDGDDWRVEPHAAFAAAGLVPVGPGLVFDRPVAGAAADPRTPGDTDLAVSFALPPFSRYAAPADPPMMRAALQLGGTLVAVTHATDPDTLTTATQVQAALNDPRTLIGWTAFGQPDPVAAAGATREPAPLGPSTYVLHWNRQHLTVGRQLAHTPTAMTDREAREWATGRLGDIAHLTDWSRVDQHRPDDGWRTMDAIALRQYVLRHHDDGWRLVNVLSTVDGPREQELSGEAGIRGWAEQVLAHRDGPAQRDLPWRPGPTTAGSHTLLADVIH